MSRNTETYRNYLFDIGLLLKEEALQARAQRETHRGSSLESFYCGQLLAFHRAVSLMQQQAVAFQIPLEDLQLKEIDPDKDLV
jgi:hypothetical protein